MRSLVTLLRWAAVPAGIGIGLWSAQLKSLQACAGYMRCPTPTTLVMQPTFTGWENGLFGLCAALGLVLAAEALHRLAPRQEVG